MSTHKERCTSSKGESKSFLQQLRSQKNQPIVGNESARKAELKLLSKT